MPVGKPPLMASLAHFLLLMTDHRCVCGAYRSMLFSSVPDGPVSMSTCEWNHTQIRSGSIPSSPSFLVSSIRANESISVRTELHSCLTT